MSVKIMWSRFYSAHFVTKCLRVGGQN